MINKGKIFKRGLSLCLLTVMAVTGIAGCGKKDKKNDDSIVNQATKNNKDYVYKAEEIKVEGMNFSNLSSLQLVGDRLYCTLIDYEKGGTQVGSFKLDGSDPKVVDIDTKKGEYMYDFAFAEDGSFYAIYQYSKDSKDDGNKDAATEGSSEDAAESKDAATKDASAKDAAAKDASAKDESKDAAAKDASVSEKKDDKKDDKSDDKSSDKATDKASDKASDSASEDVSAANDSAAESSSEEEESSPMFDYENMESAIVKCDADGNIVDKFLCESGEDDEDYFSVNSLIPYKDGKVLVSSTRGIETYSSEDGFKTIVDTSKEGSPYQGRYFYLAAGSDGQVFVQSYGEGGEVVNRLDPEKGELSEELNAFKEGFAYSGFMMYGGSGYDLYVSDQNAVYGYDMAKDELVKLMDFVDSDIDVAYGLGNMVALNDKEFIAAIPDFDYSSKLCKLTKVPADQVKDKKIITFGGNYIDYRMRQQAAKFNSESDEYKIKVVDYSTYNTDDNYKAGEERFDMDLVSGTVPDIIALSPDSATKKYESKGVFMDLKPYFDKDEDMKNVEILPNVLKAMQSGDKIYTLIPSFSVGTMVLDQKLAQGKTTINFQDCEDLIKQSGCSYETAFGLVDKNTFLGYGIVFAGDKYIDWDNKKCNFNSDEFVKLLEFANKLPNEIDWDKYEGSPDDLYKNGKAVLSEREMSGFREYQICKQCVFGNDVSFVGFPNEEGVNESFIYPTGSVAMSSHTQYADVVWKFMKSLLSDDYQTEFNYDFPSTVSGFKKRAEYALDRPFYMQDGEKVYYDDYNYSSDTEQKLKPLTQEEIDYVSDFVLSVDKEYNYNESVHDIITEEASAFFSGQKTAKEVADIIQSRVSIYVNENL